MIKTLIFGASLIANLLLIAVSLYSLIANTADFALLLATGFFAAINLAALKTNISISNNGVISSISSRICSILDAGKNPVVLASIVVCMAILIGVLIYSIPVYACSFSSSDDISPGIWMRCMHGSRY